MPFTGFKLRRFIDPHLTSFHNCLVHETHVFVCLFFFPIFFNEITEREMVCVCVCVKYRMFEAWQPVTYQLWKLYTHMHTYTQSEAIHSRAYIHTSWSYTFACMHTIFEQSVIHTVYTHTHTYTQTEGIHSHACIHTIFEQNVIHTVWYTRTHIYTQTEGIHSHACIHSLKLYTHAYIHTIFKQNAACFFIPI